MSSKTATKVALSQIDSTPSHDVSTTFTYVSHSQLSEAQAANQAEHDMSPWEAAKTYSPGVAYCIILSTTLVMEGYDIVLLSSFYAFPAFEKKFGVPTGNPSEPYQVPAAWQSGLSNGAMIGEIIGLFICGIASERYGYRRTMIGALLAVIAFIFILFFSDGRLPQLLVGEILCGIPWGIFQTLTTAYASDVCPTPLRAYLCTYNNMCWVFGQLIASGVLRSMLSRTDDWSWRIPFALQWMWPLPILIGVLFAPESPWWLVRQNRLTDARSSLQSLTSRRHAHKAFNIDAQISLMAHTTALEKASQAGTGWTDLFRGTNLRRTEICVGAWAIQNLCGNVLMGYSTYFYIQAGLPTVQSFNLTMAQYGLGVLGTISSWGLMRRLGRRTIYLYGLATLTVLLFAIGCASIRDNAAAAWAIGSLLLLYTFVYDSSIGPVCYAIVSEMPATRVKNRSMNVARNVYNLCGIADAVITPYMLNPTAWNWRGRAGFFWAGSCALCTTWCYFRLPEGRGRTYAELDLLFERGVSARAFEKAEVGILEGVEGVVKEGSGIGEVEVGGGGAEIGEVGEVGGSQVVRRVSRGM